MYWGTFGRYRFILVLVLLAVRGASGEESVPVAGMVGQVNGEAIYAHTVFDPIDEVLTQMGKREAPHVFREQASRRIRGELFQITTNKLLLSEAERDMNPQESRQLEYILQKEWEQLRRVIGDTSEFLARRQSVRLFDKTPEEIMDDKRAQILIRRYLESKIYPKIVVRRRDVARYYQEHRELFNSDTTRTIHLIRADNTLAAEGIESLLAEGVPFKDVARRQEFNKQNFEEAGLFQVSSSEELFSAPELNEAMLELKAGEHSERFTLEGWGDAWIYIDRIVEGRSLALRDVQLNIERTLRTQQFDRLTKAFRRKAFERGNFTSLDEMTEKLTEMAVVRYARQSVAGQ